MAQKLSLVYTLALLVTLCTILLSPSVEANSIDIHARMLRKRVPSSSPDIVTGPDVPVIGAGADPNAPPSTGTPTDTSTDTKTLDLPSGTGSSASIPTPSSPLSIGLSIPGLGSATSSASSSASSSSASANSTSSTSSSTSSTLTSATPIATIASTSGNQIVYSTVIASQSQQASATPTGQDDTASDASSGGSLGKNTIIAIAVIGACIGGAVVIWTVIRKWKFAPSDEFGDRLNPIDWRPTSASDKDLNEKPGEGEGNGGGHRRTGSRASNRSFVSADAHSMRNTPTPAPGNMIPDLPQHDFTAGAANGYGNTGLAPVGAYADLRRGPSPAPSMNAGDGYYRGYGASQFGHNGY